MRARSPKPPEQAQAWSLIGIAYARLTRANAPSMPFVRPATLAPEDEAHWLNLTRELMELNRYPEAVTAVQSGLAANPKSYALHLRLARHTWRWPVRRSGKWCFRDLVSAGDPLPTGYVGLAQVLLKNGPRRKKQQLTSAMRRKS